MHAQKQLTVDELINILKKQDPKAKVFSSLGGNYKYEPVTHVFGSSALHEEDEGGVLIGSLSW